MKDNNCCGSEVLLSHDSFVVQYLIFLIFDI